MEQLTIRQIRAELQRLLAMSVLANPPAPTRKNGPEHAMPGVEWEVDDWVVRSASSPDDSGAIYVSPPGLFGDFLAVPLEQAGPLAAALIAALDHANQIPGEN